MAILLVMMGLSSILTWAICKRVYEEKRERDLRASNAQSQSSIDIHERFHAILAMSSLQALQATEAGNLESAKTEMASLTVALYRQFDKSGKDEFLFKRSADNMSLLQTAQRDIERHAKKSDALRAALARESDVEDF
jgi:hypothetical protein